MRAAIFLIVGLIAATVSSAREDKTRPAGKTENGFLLPNGWTITPVGDQLELSDLPLNILPLSDGKRALVSTNGYNAHELSLIDLGEKKSLDRETIFQSWFGL